MAEKAPAVRFLALDLLRTVAIVCMIAYHLLFDLWYFYNGGTDPTVGAWSGFRIAVASLFLLLAGASFVISARGRTRRAVWLRTFRRAGLVLACALLVSAATFLTDPGTFIRFGILHLIGVSLLLLPFFRSLKAWNILPGTLALLLRLPPPAFRTLDYYPLFPWFGVILIGMGIGHALYGTGKRRPEPITPLVAALTSPGRHSLAIYMLHQPVLLGILRIFLE